MNQQHGPGLLSAVVTLALAVALPAVADPPPAPWLAQDIGSPSLKGATDVDPNGVWTLQGSSTFLGDRADHLHFAYQPVRGDATITGRFLKLVGGHLEWARVGLMVRESTSPGAPNLYYYLRTVAQGLAATLRFRQDGASSYFDRVGPSNRPLYLRLQRAGNEIAGFYSRDGSLWFQAGFAPQTLSSIGENALFGFAITSQSDGALTTGKFDQVQLQSGAVSVSGIRSCGGDKAVLLQWRKLSGAVAYNVYRGPAGGARDTLVKLNTDRVTGTSFTDSSDGLVNGTPMTYAVAAVFLGADGNPVEGPLVAFPATPVAVPPGYLGCSINEGARSGSAAFDVATGEITVQGVGFLTFDTADGLYFVNQPVEGDIQITVNALSKRLPISDWALAGLMIREELEASSRYLAVWITSSGGLFAQWRSSSGGFADWPGQFAVGHGSLSMPVTLRLTRQGNTITPEYSTDDGKTFRVAGQPVTFSPALAKTLFVGVAVAAANRSGHLETSFRDLRIR